MPSDNADLATIGRGEICDLQCLPGYRSKLPNQSSEIFCSGASPGDGSPLFWLAGVLRTNETIHFRQSIPRAEDLYLNDVVRPNMVGCEKITVELIEDIEEYEEELDKSIDKIVEEAEDAKEVKEDVLVAFVVEDKRFTTRTTTTTTTASTSSVYQGPKIVVQPSPTSSTTTTTTSDGLTKTTTPKTTTTEENPFAQWEKQVTEADLDGMLQTPNPNEEYETTPEPEPEPDYENEDKDKKKKKKKDSPSSAVKLLVSFLAIFLICV